MVKAYLRYCFEQVIGAISQNGGIIVNDIAYSAIDQYVIIVNLKTQQIIQQITVEEKNVTINIIALLGQILAIGYSDGEIITYDLKQQQIISRLLNHQSGITCLKFMNETILISGSQDTSIIIWDLVDESLQLRLMGHVNAITGLEIMEFEDQLLGVSYNYVISSSKDGLIKVWDINLEDSVATISSLHSEITAITQYSNYLIICTNSEEIVIKTFILKSGKLEVQDQGIFKRQTFARVIQCHFISDRLFILNNDKKIEIYRLKQLKNKKIEELKLFSQQLVYANIINLTIKSQYFQVTQISNTVRMYLFSLDNVIMIKNIGFDNQEQNTNTIGQTQGSIKQLLLTQNDTKLFVLTQKKCHIYETQYNEKISDYGQLNEFTSLSLLPKNKYYLLGDDKGNLSLMDMNVNECIHELKVHNGAINNIIYHENSKAFNGLIIMTTEIEKKVNFIELFYNKKESKLELAIVNSIYLKENIRNIQISNNGQFYAISLLNNMIQIYYCDTHKLYIELYGHSLPVLSMAYTSDDTMIISGGVDKSIKIWACDFGNCKKTIKAHQGEVCSIKTIQDTHYFFSAARDNTVKYWDGDTYQLVMSFNQNLQQITSLAIGCIGDVFYVGSKNGIIRKYFQTKEQIFVQDEEEKRNQEQLVIEIQNKNKSQNTLQTGGKDEVVRDLSLQQISQHRLYEAEELMDLLEKIRKHREDEEMGEDVNLELFGNKDPTEYLFKLLDQSQIVQLLKFLHHQHFLVLINEMNRELAYKRFPSTLSNILNYVYNKFDGYQLHSHEILMKIMNIREQLQIHYKKEKKQVGFNIDVVQMLLKDIEKDDEDYIFE